MNFTTSQHGGGVCCAFTPQLVYSVVHALATDRYRSLPATDHRLEFARLQLELLEDFRVRLLQVRKEMLDNEQSVITPQMCSILNTVSYIEGVLQQWNNLPVCSLDLLSMMWCGMVCCCARGYLQGLAFTPHLPPPLEVKKFVLIFIVEKFLC